MYDIEFSAQADRTLTQALDYYTRAHPNRGPQHLLRMAIKAFAPVRRHPELMQVRFVNPATQVSYR